jgi:phosphoglucosamine mutase
MFADETGTVRDGDEQLCLFGLELHRRGELTHDTVVATVMSNLGLHSALAKAGIKVLTTPVGDRHVVAAMRDGGYMLGGEQSGHILFGGDGELCGDGLYTALRLLALPGARRGLSGTFERFPQVLQNVRVLRKPDLETVPAVAAKAAAVRAALGQEGRLVLRYSGTEPLCRVMVEGRDRDMVQRLCSELADCIAAELGT